MKRPLSSLLALVCAVTAPSSSAIAQKETATGVEVEKDIALLRRNLRTEKKKVVALNMPLTETEATKFWPVYDQYTGAMSKHYDEFYTVIRDYAANQKTLTDAQAIDMIKRWSRIQVQLAQTREEYVPIIGKVIPGKKGGTLLPDRPASVRVARLANRPGDPARRPVTEGPAFSARNDGPHAGPKHTCSIVQRGRACANGQRMDSGDEVEHAGSASAVIRSRHRGCGARSDDRVRWRPRRSVAYHGEQDFDRADVAGAQSRCSRVAHGDGQECFRRRDLECERHLGLARAAGRDDRQQRERLRVGCGRDDRRGNIGAGGGLGGDHRHPRPAA